MTRALYEYWSELRAARRAPMRLELDPRAIAPLLGNAFVLERLNPRTYKYRLAGTRVCSYHDLELRGRSFLDQWQPFDRQTMESLLQAATNDAAGAVIGYEAFARRDLKVAFEMVLLPLARDNGTFDRVIGVTAPLSTAYWVGIMPIIDLEIKSVRYLWPDDMPIPASVESAPEPAGTLLAGADKPVPVFIVGFPRSGTS
ncbi:MAG: PAS domain-containing protein, partial [Hyphomicrobiales bacterium]